ncbi:hypothetical protein FRC01_012586 [Tulasnella sp. 417]|nr:hypothetical protein FRC01_012586 [Tulasnella sp. 417]
MADLFIVPQGLPPDAPDSPNRANAVLNGIPFVKLHDNKDDFANLMDLVYPATITNKAKDSLDAVRLMRVIHLADKYVFEDIKEWGVGELESKHLLAGDGDPPVVALRSGRYSDPHFCVQVAQFARECTLPQFLPFVFYALATTDWTQEPERLLLLDDLSPRDRCRIQEGRLSLTKAVLKQAYSMPENGNSGVRCTAHNCPKDSAIWGDPLARWTALLMHPLEELQRRLITRAMVCVNAQVKSPGSTDTEYVSPTLRGLSRSLIRHIKGQIQPKARDDKCPNYRK